MTTLEVTAAEIDRLVREQFSIIETGDLALADANVTADFVNHRAGHEPLAARGRGPEALKSTAGWIPPTPGYILKMRSARRRARKAQAA